MISFQDYENFIFTGETRNNWFYLKYYFAGSNARYYTFQLALNLLLQKKQNPIIIETGCQRAEEDIGAGMSTSIFGEFCQRYGGHVFTIDISYQHIEICKQCTQPFSKVINYVCSDSIQALETLGKKDCQADLLYLDSVDFPIGSQAEDIALRNLSQLHCLKEFDVASQMGIINQNTILLLDDNQLPYGGKPRLLKQKLIQSGEWVCLLDFQQSIWVKRESF